MHRKLRLFACGCCRRIWHLLHQNDRECVEGGEIIAEGGSYSTARSIDYAQSEAEGAALSTLEDDANLAARRAADFASSELGNEAACEGAFSEYVSRILAERRVQNSLLCCIIVPLPFRSVTLDSSWVAWNDALVVRLAQAAYDERHLPSGTLDNGRLAVLADALEEAGYTDADVLGHLREPGPHVRGCWAVDICLGKS